MDELQISGDLEKALANVIKLERDWRALAAPQNNRIGEKIQGVVCFSDGCPQHSEATPARDALGILLCLKQDEQRLLTGKLSYQKPTRLPSQKSTP